MKIDNPWIHRLAALLGTAAVRRWMATLDYKVAYYDRSIDPVFPECRGRKIYIFWHEYILFPLYLRGHCRLAALLSRHRDAEILSYAAYHLGFEVVRGSTSRGGVTALRRLLHQGRHLNLAITPDGPRGPRRRLAPGAVYLASRLGMPLVAMGFGYDRPWRAPSWDRFAIPRPGSRARAITSPAVHVPPDLDRKGIEHYRGKIEALLNHLTELAEHWAAGGYRLPEQHRLRKQTAPLDRTSGKRSSGLRPAPCVGDTAKDGGLLELQEPDFLDTLRGSRRRSA